MTHDSNNPLKKAAFQVRITRSKSLEHVQEIT